MRKIYEFQKYRTLRRIQEKIEKSEDMDKQRDILKQKRKEQREEVDRNKVIYEPVTPGPGDYQIAIPALDRHSPAIKFGTSRDTNRNVGSRAQASATRGVHSPGPAAYAAAECPVLKSNPKCAMPKADRFSSSVFSLEDLKCGKVTAQG